MVGSAGPENGRVCFLRNYSSFCHRMPGTLFSLQYRGSVYFYGPQKNYLGDIR